MSAVRVRHRPPAFPAPPLRLASRPVTKAARRSLDEGGLAPWVRLLGQPARLLRLHRPVRERLLRHAGIERHVRVGAEPYAVLTLKDHRGAARALERRAVLMIAGAHPRDDHGC